MLITVIVSILCILRGGFASCAYHSIAVVYLNSALSPNFRSKNT